MLNGYSNGRPKVVRAQRARRYTLMSDWAPETVFTQPVARSVYSGLDMKQARYDMFEIDLVL